MAVYAPTIYNSLANHTVAATTGATTTVGISLYDVGMPDGYSYSWEVNLDYYGTSSYIVVYWDNEEVAYIASDDWDDLDTLESLVGTDGYTYHKQPVTHGAAYYYGYYGYGNTYSVWYQHTVVRELNGVFEAASGLEYNATLTTTTPTTGWSSSSNITVNRGQRYYLWARRGVGYEDRTFSALPVPTSLAPANYGIEVYDALGNVTFGMDNDTMLFVATATGTIGANTTTLLTETQLGLPAGFLTGEEKVLVNAPVSALQGTTPNISFGFLESKIVSDSGSFKLSLSNKYTSSKTYDVTIISRGVV